MMRLVRMVLIGVIFVSLSALVGCVPLSFLSGIEDGTTRVIDYTPLHFNPNTQTFPTGEQIRADLEQLYDEGYRGVTTFDVDGTLSQVPRLAKEVGFKVIGVGIWDIANEELVNTAIGLSEDVNFYVVGSEGLLRGSYTVDQLRPVMKKIRAATHKAVTTAETFDILLQNPELITLSDFVAVNIYGWWEGARTPWGASELFVAHYEAVVDAVQALDPGKKVIVRETGFPTGGHPDASVQKQIDYFALLEQSDIPFFYFEAYDQPWKAELCDGYNIGTTWGLHDSAGNLKEVEPPPPAISFTSVPALGSTTAILKGKVVGVDRLTHSVVVYIKVGSIYWVKPYANTPLTTILANGTWQCNINTGGEDPTATEVRAYVVSKNYSAQLHTLPSQSDYIAFAVATR